MISAICQHAPHYLARILTIGNAGEMQATLALYPDAFVVEIPARYPYRHGPGDDIPFTSYGSFDPSKARSNIAVTVGTEGT